jgi:UDP-N-acetylglucosamine 2-epimerase
MIKVITVIGTRPEIIKLSRVIYKLDKYFENILVHTGQNFDYELNKVFFDDLNIREPDYYLDSAKKTVGSTIGEIFKKIEPILVKEKPSAFLILGDTNSSLSAIIAKKLKIPIFHMEAGNRSFDERVPEEINRRIIDHIADINMPYSDISREYLVNEGINPEQIIKTGSPVYEVLNFYKDKIKKSKILKKLNLKKKKYFLFSLHREENVDDLNKLRNIKNIFAELIKKYNFEIIVSTHPRTKKSFDKLNFKNTNKIKFLKPFGFIEYIKLQLDAKCVMSDSGTITEESSILNFPALNLRETHERPEGMEEGSVMMVGMNEKLILNCLKILEDQYKSDKRILNNVRAYNVQNVSDKIVRIISSYIDYVDKFIWKKN